MNPEFTVYSFRELNSEFTEQSFFLVLFPTGFVFMIIILNTHMEVVDANLHDC